MRTQSSGTRLRRKLIGRSSWQRLFGWLLVAYLIALPLTVMAAPLASRLAHHPSPHLALHGADPVAWQEWSPATVALARALRRSEQAP